MRFNVSQSNFQIALEHLQKSLKLWNSVVLTTLNQRDRDVLLSGCFSQNWISALREMICTRLFYLKMRYSASAEFTTECPMAG